MAQFDSGSPRSQFTTQRNPFQPPASMGPDEVIGTPALFVLGIVFGTLIVIAVVTNGPGAGTGHHHFVRYLLTGLFVSGGGLVGLVVTTAMCGRIGLYDSEEAIAEQSRAIESAPTEQMNAQLNRQRDQFVRRMHNTTTPAASTPVAMRPAPPQTSLAHAASESPAEPEADSESSSGQVPAAPHAQHFRRRRNRRA